MLKKLLNQHLRLKSDQIFEGLAEEYETLVRSGVTHAYKKGEVIFREGGIPTGIYYVKSGRIKKYKVTPRAAEQIFYICTEGDLLGYHALLADEHYPDSAATIENALITFIPKESFLQVLHGSNPLANKLLKALGHEFNIYVNSLTTLGTKTLRERLAFNLLILEEKFKPSGRPLAPTEITMSRTDLASMVGTAKESLVRLLHDFQDEGLIDKTARTITLINKKAIIREANLMGFGNNR